ncbi:MAG: TonB-dependent receptor, partial [Rhodothermales bacterium]|nr:TonB-dependent receptor [Rhodothermales bacterium]
MRPTTAPPARLTIRALASPQRVLLGAGSAYAQYGKITGTITDATTGEGLPGVNVVLDGAAIGAATDIDGQYTIIGLRPDTYTVVVSYVGYQTARVEGVRVSIDRTTELDVALEEEVFEGDEVVVTAERELVPRDVTSTAAFVSGDEIRALPVENFDQVVELQAGVVNGHFRGGRLGEVGYWVDGLPVTDVYDGALALEIENDMVQEAQVVTGAFNAEYGQAMSGIVNVVTRDGSNDVEGSFSGFLGDYVTSEEEVASGAPVFPELDRFSATAIQNAELSLSGPVLRDRLFFFTSGRYFKNAGHIYGRDYFSYESVQVDPETSRLARVDTLADGTSVFGDSAAVALNPYEKVSGQAKLTAQLGRGIRVAANVIASQEEFNAGDQFPAFFFPDALLDGRRRAYSAYLKFTHALTNTTFYEAGLTNNYAEYEEHLFEDPLDERYREGRFFEFRDPLQTSNFLVGGTNNRRFSRSTDTWLGKLDLTSQVNDNNLVKTGLEARYHTLDFADEFVVVLDEEAATPEARGQFVVDNGSYSYHPVEVSAYLQDKLELGGLIINAGLRFDYFDSGGRVLRDPRDPDAVFLERRLADQIRENPGLSFEDADFTPDEFFEDAEPKWQVSPRLGVAFPISADGVVHFSYGQFFQVPNFELLYQNP